MCINSINCTRKSCHAINENKFYIFHSIPHFQLRSKRDEELSLIGRELRFLESNLLKERARLEAVVAEKDAVIRRQAQEIEQIKKAGGAKKVGGSRRAPTRT